MHEARVGDTLSDDARGTMEDSGRSASEAKAIHSEGGLETVITGGESVKADTSKVTDNITPKTSDILDKDNK